MICSACQAPNDAAAASCIACGRRLAAEPGSPQPGILFASRYEILGILGRGGMGMVYKAHDRSLDETIALKVIRPDLARESHLHERFRSEIKLARRIRHKNVCSIFGDGEDGGVFYICMELVDGVDLRQLVRERGGLPPAEAFDLAIQIADGLQAIHEVGIIHRDLKTANVMRDSRGLVRLMDFGLAKQWRSEDSSGATAAGHVVGTPDYMSPEQARGEKLTFASDLYALGIVIFELFTGEPPFRGDTPLTTLLKHLHDAPPFEGSAGRRLPRALVPVLGKALAKQPRERFGSAAAMAEALRSGRLAARFEDGATPAFVPRLNDAANSLSPAETPAVTAAMSTTVASRPGAHSRPWTRARELASGPWGWGLATAGVLGMAAVSLQNWSSARLSGPSPGATVVRPPSPVTQDDKGEFIQHEPVGCFLASRFPLVAARSRFDAASIKWVRIYFKSALGSDFYFVEASRGSNPWTGKLPKPKLEASPITYFVEIATDDGRRWRTREHNVLVVESVAGCPAGVRLAEVGPTGAVTVFSSTTSITTASRPADLVLRFAAVKNAIGLGALVGSLKDPSVGVREKAAESLRAMMPLLDSLVSKALLDLKSSEAEARARGAGDLADLHEELVKEAMIPLLAAVRDENPLVQVQAADALGEIGPLVARAAKALMSALKDPEAAVRQSAAQALGIIGPVVGTTLTVLNDVAATSRVPVLVLRIETASDRIQEAGR